MRTAKLLAVMMIAGVSHTAWAQEQPYSQTLDEQMQRLQQGKAPVPMVVKQVRPADEDEPKPAAQAETERKPVNKEWPASANAAPEAKPATEAIVAQPTPLAPLAAQPTQQPEPQQAQTQPALTQESPPAIQAAQPQPTPAAEMKPAETVPTPAAAMETKPAEMTPAVAPQAAPAAEPQPATVPMDTASPSAGGGEAIDSVGSGAIPALPIQPMIAGEVKFVTGGIGDEELDMLKSVEQEYNVQLLLTATKGEFISEAVVHMMDDAGNKLLAINHVGPYLYMALKPGKYHIEVTAKRGGIKTVDLAVPAQKTIKQQLRFSE